MSRPIQTTRRKDSRKLIAARARHEQTVRWRTRVFSTLSGRFRFSRLAVVDWMHSPHQAVNAIHIIRVPTAERGTAIKVRLLTEFPADKLAGKGNRIRGLLGGHLTAANSGFDVDAVAARLAWTILPHFNVLPVRRLA
jgi:hypothetical protein